MPEFEDREEYERWKEEKLRQNQEKLRAAPTEPPPDGPAPSIQQRPPGNSLSEIDDLLKLSWTLFKQRIAVLLPLQLLSIVFVLAATLIAVGAGAVFAMLLPQLKSVIIVISLIFGITVGMTVMFWPMAALVIAVTDNSLGITDALAQGWKKLWSFLWLFSILGYVVAGGYLLFIVPGVIFTVWFIFSQFILATENIKGMDAMLKSKEYVKDRWFDICLRFLVIWGISMGLGMIPLLGILLSLLFAPFMMIYTNLVYKDLKALKPDPLLYENSTAEKMKWTGLATLGYIVLPLIIIAIAGALCAIPLLMLKGITLPQSPQRFF